MGALCRYCILPSAVVCLVLEYISRTREIDLCSLKAAYLKLDIILFRSGKLRSATKYLDADLLPVTVYRISSIN